jgi:hypothetical protein
MDKRLVVRWPADGSMICWWRDSQLVEILRLRSG